MIVCGEGVVMGGRCGGVVGVVVVLVGVVVLGGCGGRVDVPVVSSGSSVAVVGGSGDGRERAVDAYVQFSAQAYGLQAVSVGSRRGLMSGFATGVALDEVVRAAAARDGQQVVNLGFVTVFPQVVAWSGDTMVLYDCPNFDHALTRQGQYGPQIGGASDRFVEAVVVRGGDGGWRVSEVKQRDVGCVAHADHYFLLHARSQPGSPQEIAAFEAYANYWKLVYKLPNNPKSQWKSLVSEFASGKPAEVALSMAEDIVAKHYTITGEAISNPVVTGTNPNYFEVYDCRDDSTIHYVDKAGTVKGSFKKDVPFRTGIAKSKDGRWRVVGLAKLGEGVQCK